MSPTIHQEELLLGQCHLLRHTPPAVLFTDILDPATDSRYLCTSTYYWGNASVLVNKYPPSHKRADDCTAPRVPEIKILFSGAHGHLGFEVERRDKYSGCVIIIFASVLVEEKGTVCSVVACCNGGGIVAG